MERLKRERTQATESACVAQVGGPCACMRCRAARRREGVEVEAFADDQNCRHLLAYRMTTHKPRSSARAVPNTLTTGHTNNTLAGNHSSTSRLFLCSGHSCAEKRKINDWAQGSLILRDTVSASKISAPFRHFSKSRTAWHQTVPLRLQLQTSTFNHYGSFEGSASVPREAERKRLSKLLYVNSASQSLHIGPQISMRFMHDL